LSAAATVCVLPMIAFALFLQRYIVRGLTFGAVRG
jgi:multiple sugar transport system permease protein